MGKKRRASPGLSLSQGSGVSDVGFASYLKKHTEALVKDVGIEAACELTGKSKATLGPVLFGQRRA
jgi:hypothetical protein